MANAPTITRLRAARTWEVMAEQKELAGQRIHAGFRFSTVTRPRRTGANTFTSLLPVDAAFLPCLYLIIISTSCVLFALCCLENNLRLLHFKRTEHLLSHLLQISKHKGDLLFYQGELYRLRNDPGPPPPGSVPVTWFPVLAKGGQEGGA
ncbi:MAG: hypothetical protein FD153_1323 [Rhodospirillaceae bacterium]|nr:MAG: hypothetical protein FD153_1323 [Rhodospirillaceae bacterium]